MTDYANLPSWLQRRVRQLQEEDTSGRMLVKDVGDYLIPGKFLEEGGTIRVFSAYPDEREQKRIEAQPYLAQVIKISRLPDEISNEQARRYISSHAGLMALESSNYRAFSRARGKTVLAARMSAISRQRRQADDWLLISLASHAAWTGFFVHIPVS